MQLLGFLIGCGLAFNGCSSGSPGLVFWGTLLLLASLVHDCKRS